MAAPMPIAAAVVRLVITLQLMDPSRAVPHLQLAVKTVRVAIPPTLTAIAMVITLLLVVVVSDVMAITSPEPMLARL